MNVEEGLRWLRSAAQLERAGITARMLASHVQHGRMQRVDRGWYVDGASWREWTTEERHLIRVLAAHRRRSADGGRGTVGGVFSHASAAVLWELPLARWEPDRVQISGDATNGRVRGGDPLVSRHRASVAPSDTAIVHSLPCTSLARTVADLLRTTSEETGLAALDAALRMRAWDDSGRRYDETAADDFSGEVDDKLQAGARGVRRARRLLPLGDGRAQLPGESISRLYLLRLGFARPRLQVPIAGPRGRSCFVDFGLDDADVWGEFDGRAKYTDPDLRGSRADLEDVMFAEKEREDWIRGVSGRRIVRWGGRDIRDASALRQRLAAFSVYPRSTR